MRVNTNIIHVHYLKGTEKVAVGRLATKNRSIYFEYEAGFLKTGIELSPFRLPLKQGVVQCDDPLFNGLFGVFNDSLPDGWGRLLLDRKLMKLGISTGTLTPLDRLQYVGSHGMGALTYEPEMDSPAPVSHDSLDEIANECFQFQENDDDSFVDDLLLMNGSSAGARPKILVDLTNNTFQASTKRSQHNLWIIKFRSSLDPTDVGPIEYAYHLMAKAAGLDVPEAKLFNSQKGPGYFGVKRFDRSPSGYHHMHTLSGLIHVDHRIPALDYETLMKVTLILTKDSRECEKQFRNAVFNVLTHNRDDHAKNFSFLMDENGIWRVSPAYDLTFSSGPAGEQCTTVMGEGKNPGVKQLLKLAQTSNIDTPLAIEIINEVQNATSKFQTFANDANVSKKSSSIIQSALDRISKIYP